MMREKPFTKIKTEMEKGMMGHHLMQKNIKSKKNLYFNEFNLLMGSGGIVYLPLVSGILSAYIKTSKIIRDNIRVRSKLSEVDRLVCDNKKVIKFTKWRPKIKFSTGLDKTIEWFKLNKHLYRNDIYQI